VLRTATDRVAILLNEGTPTHLLPPEILTRILYLAVDHGSEEHAEQIIPLTHVCRYWRTLLLSYPRIWSTLRMKPGNPSVISEWLARSQNVPLTVLAEFTDTYDHPPCRYQDPTAALTSTVDLKVCPRHRAVLSLDQILPHCSRIRDLNIVVRWSDSHWMDGDHGGEPPLLYHHFFKETLPNLQRLDFRATHTEQTRYAIPIPDHLFAGGLPGLKELKYLGVNGGLTGTVKNLVSCEIGVWWGSAGPAMISPEELQTLFNNNQTVKSLIIGECEFFYDSDPWVPTATSMTDLEYLEIHCPVSSDLEKIVKCIHAPRLGDLDTVQLSFSGSSIRVVATDSSGHTFEFSQSNTSDLDFHPLRHLGADITTLRLGQGSTLQRLDEGTALCEFLRSLNAVQVLEFDGAIASAENVLSNVLSITGVFPGLRVIRVAVGRDDCKGTLQLLSVVLRLRMEEGNQFTTIEPLLAEGEGGLGQELCAEWERHCEAEGIHNFWSKYLPLS